MLTKPFLLLCASIFLIYANQSILTPTIPLYVTQLGGSASLAGLALLAFSAPSFLVRPILGRLSDQVGATMMLIAGLVGLAASGAIFFVPMLAAVFVASAGRGVSWAAVNIGGYSFLATAAPPDRRGEAAGYYTSVLASASILFPALALWMINGEHGGFAGVFVVSLLFACASIPVAVMLHRFEHRNREPPAEELAPTPSGKTLNRGMIAAMALNLSQALPAPAVAAFLPLYARAQHIGDVSWFYVIAGILTVAIRPMLGRRSDSIGQGPIIAIGLAAQGLGYVLIWLGASLPVVMLGAIISSFGPALIGSATTALAMNAAPPARRGQAMATFTMMFQVGMGFGSVLAGALADLVGLRNMYLGPIFITLIGAGVLVAMWRTLPRPVVAATPSPA